MPRPYVGTHRRKTWVSTLMGWAVTPAGLAAALVLLTCITFGVAHVIGGASRDRRPTLVGASRHGVVPPTPPTSAMTAVRGSDPEAQPTRTVITGQSLIGTLAVAALRGTRTGPAVPPSPALTRPKPATVTVPPTTTSTSTITSSEITTTTSPATTTTTKPKPRDEGPGHIRRRPPRPSSPVLAPGDPP